MKKILIPIIFFATLAFISCDRQAATTTTEEEVVTDTISEVGDTIIEETDSIVIPGE